MSARVCAELDGYGELVQVGHEVVLLVQPDADPDGEVTASPALYWPQDWADTTGPTAELDDDGDAAFLDGDGRRVSYAPVRRPRCASEAARFRRVWDRRLAAAEAPAEVAS